MLIQANKIDPDGTIIEPVLVLSTDVLQSNIISVPVPEGLYIPKWTGQEWVDSATEEYKFSVDNPKKDLTEADILRAELETLREEKKQSDLAILELSEYLMSGGI